MLQVYRPMHVSSKTWSAFGFIAALCALPAYAAECGNVVSSYKAKRTVTVNDSVARSVVYISGDKMREEMDVNGHVIVTLRQARVPYAITYDATTKEGMKLPAPPPPANRPATRVVEEKSGEGTVYHTQFDSKGKWIEVSTTRCNVAGVMTSQTFTSFDPQGKLVDVMVNQDNIVPGSLDMSLFEVPPFVTIKQPEQGIPR